MRCECLDLLFLAHDGEDGVGVHEWIFGRGQPLDESRSSFEELGKLVDTQLPR